MNFINKMLALNAGTKKKLFQREIESAFQKGKQIKLPPLPAYQEQQRKFMKNSFPFEELCSEEKREHLKNFLMKSGLQEPLLASACKVLENKFSFYHLNEISLGSTIDWNIDSLSSFTFPDSLFWKIELEQFPKGVDPQNAWEIGRMHNLTSLGLAFLLSGDEKYSEKYFGLLESFTTATANYRGIQWTNAFEVGIRLLNIIFSWGFFLSSTQVDENRYRLMQKIIMLHTFYLEHTIEHAEVRDHRYLLVHLALLSASGVIQNKAYADRLFHFSVLQFEKEMRRQVFDDGVSFEQSVRLHPLNIEIFLLAKYLMDKKGKKVSEEYNRRLHKMFEVLKSYCRVQLHDNDEMVIPNIGDAFTSPLLALPSKTLNDHIKQLLFVGAALFHDDALMPMGDAQPLYFSALYGTNQLASLQEKMVAASETVSSGFPHGGHFIMRTKELDLFIRAAEIGKHGAGAPGHNDTFTFELLYKNKLFFVDPGTYSFYADKDLRNKLRSVFSHNTFSVDNTQLADFSGLFDIKEDLTSPKIIEWRSDNEEDVLIGQHFAYVRLADPVICKRAFYWLKEKKKIKIKDEFIGGRKHKIVSHLHLHPDVVCEKIGTEKYLLSQDGVLLQVTLHSSSENFVSTVEDGMYSPSYMALYTTTKIHAVLHETLPTFYIIEIDLL